MIKKSISRKQLENAWNKATANAENYMGKKAKTSSAFKQLVKELGYNTKGLFNE